MIQFVMQTQPKALSSKHRQTTVKTLLPYICAGSRSKRDKTHIDHYFAIVHFIC